MQLFISKGLWRYRNYQIKLEDAGKNRSKLIVSNFKEDENKNKMVEKMEFVLPIKKEDLAKTYENQSTDFSKLRKTSKGYVFDKNKTTNSKIVYALLYYDEVVPSEIYIPSTMKEYVEVLETIQFYDVEPDYGDYLVKIHFVKITIPLNKSIPFFLSWRNNPRVLDKHLVFFNGRYSGINTRMCKTYILLDSSFKHDYISLSDL